MRGVWEKSGCSEAQERGCQVGVQVSHSLLGVSEGPLESEREAPV